LFPPSKLPLPPASPLSLSSSLVQTSDELVMDETEDRCVSVRDLSVRILTGCLLSLLILSTLLGNMLVCAAIIMFRHLRSKVTNVFIISLAVSDLFVALLVMPWQAVSEVIGYWPFGAFCNAWVAFDIMCSTASILNLCVISVDRYWAISSPFQYECRMTQHVACIMISTTWTLSVLISFIPVLNRTYAIASSLISFYIPVAVMLVTYTKIYLIAHKQVRLIAALERAAEHAHTCHADASDSSTDISFKNSFKREAKTLKTLSIIMGVFVFCWLPFFILNCVLPIFMWFGWANSAINPIIYSFNADFRRAFAVLFSCGSVCIRSPVQSSHQLRDRPPSSSAAVVVPQRAHHFTNHGPHQSNEEGDLHLNILSATQTHCPNPADLYLLTSLALSQINNLAVHHPDEPKTMVKSGSVLSFHLFMTIKA
uniref:Dopamine D1 receptor n=1 Tax=Eptatretus burgeri TaxID=7764 RepID=A0A8C4NL30_EPTBU